MVSASCPSVGAERLPGWAFCSRPHDKATFDLYAVWEKINGWDDANKAPEAAPWL